MMKMISVTTLLASVIWLVIGIWIGRKYTERKWKNNAMSPGNIECEGRIYKVYCDQTTRNLE